MLTIDTHYHASLSWFEPVEFAIFQMDRSKVDKMVLVQIKGEFNNRYLIECMRRYPGKFSIAGIVDTRQADAGEKLAYWTSEGMEGVRLWNNERSPGSDPLAIWKKAQELKLVVSCAGSSQGFMSEDFHKLVKALPRLSIVIEHLGINERPDLTNGKPTKEALADYKKLLSIATYPNVTMKIAGLSEFQPRPMPARNPPFDMTKVPPLIEMAVEAFGAKRIMIGADPTSSIREGYANLWKYLREYLSRYSKAEQEAIFGKTAESVFPFKVR